MNMEGRINATGTLSRKVAELDIWPDDQRVMAITNRFDTWYRSAPTRPVVGDDKYNAGVVIWDDADALYKVIQDEEDTMYDQLEGMYDQLEGAYDDLESKYNEPNSGGDSKESPVDCQQTDQLGSTPVVTGDEATSELPTDPRGKVDSESEDTTGSVNKPGGEAAEGTEAASSPVIPTKEDDMNDLIRDDSESNPNTHVVDTTSMVIPIGTIVGSISSTVRYYTGRMETSGRPIPASVLAIGRVLPHAGSDDADVSLRYFNRVWSSSRSGLSRCPIYGDKVSRSQLWRRWWDMTNALLLDYDRPTRGQRVAMALSRVPGAAMVVMDAMLDTVVAVNIKVAESVGRMGGAMVGGAVTGVAAAVQTIGDTHKAQVVARYTAGPSELDVAYQGVRFQHSVDRAVRREVRAAHKVAMPDMVRLEVARRMAEDGVGQ